MTDNDYFNELIVNMCRQVAAQQHIIDDLKEANKTLETEVIRLASSIEKKDV